MAFNAFGSTNTFGGAANKPAFGFGSTSPNTNTGFGFGAKPAATGFGAPTTSGGFGTSSFGGTSNMFGQPAATNTFGSPSTGSAFGKSFSTTTNLGGLGGSTGAFGSSPGGGFGASAFGAKPAGSPSTPFGGGGAFGATAQPSAFGGGGGAFGSTTTGSTFGSSAFGAPAATSAFGAPAASASPFGAAASAFGGAPAPAFGAAAAPAFGASAAPAFGAAAAPAFGSTGTSAFGGGSAFGGAATTQPAAGGFGAFGSGSAFGQPAASSGAFGSTGLGGGSPFGAGAGATGFGATAGATTGTGNPKFSPFPIQETVNKAGHNQVTTLSLQVITGMAAYNTKSVEELRFEDYQRGNKTGNAVAGGAFGLGAATSTNPFGAPAAAGATGGFGSGAFGAPAAAPASSFSFGAPAATPAAANPFGGAGATSAFGAASAPAFGSAFGATAAPAFGASAAPAFGAAAAPAFGSTGTSAFGSPSGSTFGSLGASSTTGSAFGSAASPFGGLGGSTSTFGSSAFGAPAAGASGAAPAFGSAFGSGGGGGAFGQTQPATSAFGAPAAAPAASSGFSFGSPAGAAGPAFGAPAGTTSAFGQPAAGGLSFGSAFGSTAATAAPTSAFGSAFGTKPATTFGATTTAPSFSFGATAGAPAAGSSGFSFGAPATVGGSFGAAPAATGTGMFGSTGGGFGTSFGAPTTASPWLSGGQTNQMQQLIQDQMFAAQQRQLLIQQQQVVAQQEQRDLSVRIDFLLRKKENLLASKESEASKSTLAAPVTDGTFLGFSGVNALKPPSLELDSPVKPRSWQDDERQPKKEKEPMTLLLPPIPGLNDGSSGNMSRNLLRIEQPLIVPASPAPGGLTPASNVRGSRLQLKLNPYELREDQNPLGDLPPPEFFANNSNNGNNMRSANRSAMKPMTPSTETPARPSGRSVTIAGEATGLTPHASVHTPLAPSSTTSSSSGTKKIINIIEDDHQRHVAFAADRSPSPTLAQNEPEVSATPPVLTRPGYFTSPAMNVLASMTDAELMRVRDFTVFRPNFGSIVWKGETDVRDLDLDAIVRIDKKEVFVYEGMETPPLGKQLNKTAVITLDNIFPKENASEAKKAAFVQKLQDFCEANDAVFIDYNLVTGVWVFEVKHFSRYGLADSDDEEDEVQSQQQPAAAVQTPAPSSVPMEAATEYASPSNNINRLRSYLTKSPATGTASAAATPSLSVHSARRYGAAQTPGTASFLTKRPAEDQEEDRMLYPSEGFSPKVLFDRDPVGGPESQSQLMALEVPTAVTPSDPVIPSLRDLRTKDDLSRSLSSAAFFPIKQSPCFQIMQEVKASLGSSLGISEVRSDFTKTSLQPQSSATALRRGMTDYGLAMSRSFRVGWSADGRIVHPGKLMFATNDDGYGRSHRVVVESVNTVRWTSKKFGGGVDSDEEKENRYAELLVRSFEQPLSALLAYSHKEVLGTPSAHHPLTLAAGRVPLWMVPHADPTELHEYIPYLNFLKESAAGYRSGRFPSSHPDWFACKALELMDATYGQERLTISASPEQRLLDLMPQYEDRALDSPPELWERRRTALSRWLESMTAPYVDDVDNSVDSGSLGQTAPTFKRIFELLSCRRIDDAVRVAENAGMFRLASLMSQLDGDASFSNLMRDQLEIWRFSDADKTIPQDLLRIYRLLAGCIEVEVDGEVTSSIVQGLGWVRGIGILFWYCSNNETFVNTVGTLSGALESYRLCSPLADPPLSTYVTDKDPLGADVVTNTRHGLYNLLELLFPSASDSAMNETELTRKIVSCLFPAGYTRDALDYRTSYLVLALLESGGVADENATYAGIVRQHLIFQLLSCGLWQWAVFIALQIKDASARYSLSREIVLRFAGCNNWEKAESSVPYTEAFLAEKLNVPEVWIHEATAYRHGYTFNRAQQAVYLNFAKQWSQAREVLCIYVAPKAILASSGAAKELLRLLEAMEEQEEQEKHAQGVLTQRHSNSYSTLSSIFVSFLRLRDFVESVLDSDLEVVRKDDVMAIDTKLNEVLTEAKELLHRLASYQSNLAVKQETGSESVYGTAVVQDMSSYLYKLISKLVALSTPPASQELFGLVSSEYLHGLPVHGNAVSKTLSNVSEGHLHGAAHRMMMV